VCSDILTFLQVEGRKMKTAREKKLEAELQQLRAERKQEAERLVAELAPLGEARRTLERELERVRTEIRAKATEAREAGASVPKIAAALGVRHQTIYEMLNSKGE
jgi:hypothetical protein